MDQTMIVTEQDDEFVQAPEKQSQWVCARVCVSCVCDTWRLVYYSELVIPVTHTEKFQKCRRVQIPDGSCGVSSNLSPKAENWSGLCKFWPRGSKLRTREEPIF